MSASQPVALVTGGSRGIGRAICLALARQGYAIGINFAGNEEAARETLRLVDGEALLCQGDVGSAGDRARLIDAVLARWDRIDVLVNNAGIVAPGRPDLLEATVDGWDRVLAVNLDGPFFLCQRVAREMIARLPRLEKPALINIGSLSSYAASVNRADYCVSKAGLSMVTQLFAARLAEHGIRVYEVSPGVIETDLTKVVHERYRALIAEGLAPIRRFGTPEDVAGAVVALVTGAIPFSTGNVVQVDGGYHLRRFP